MSSSIRDYILYWLKPSNKLQPTESVEEQTHQVPIGSMGPNYIDLLCYSIAGRIRLIIGWHLRVALVCGEQYKLLFVVWAVSHGGQAVIVVAWQRMQVSKIRGGWKGWKGSIGSRRGGEQAEVVILAFVPSLEAEEHDLSLLLAICYFIPVSLPIYILKKKKKMQRRERGG